MPRKKIEKQDELELLMENLGLDLKKIKEISKEYTELKYRIPKKYDGIKQYKQYRYIDVKDIQILLSPTNRLDDIEDKYKNASPLYEYLLNDTEEEKEKYQKLISMLKETKIEAIEKIEKEQEKLLKTIPFKVKYESNYLWQIYYSESEDKYFMIVPTKDSDYSTFFYLLKKQTEKRKNAKIFVPISNVDYSRTFFSKTEFEEIENCIWLFTKDWPLIYEVYDKEENLSLQIVGETNVYDKIKSLYKIKIDLKEDAKKLYKLLKAMFILQTDLPNYFEFRTNVNKKGNLEFYCRNQKVDYNRLSEFVRSTYIEGMERAKRVSERIEIDNKRLEELKQISAMQDIEYLEKEKQISTFLECKKSFFGKFKYYFKYSKKNKRNKIKENNPLEEIDENIEKKPKFKKNKKEENLDVKENYTIEELIDNYKELELKETEFKNIIMDINAIKLRNKNMAKKIENATSYIKEIDSHKRSIFEFWKYSNKDEISVLPEGEEEEVNVIKKITKIFDYEQDLEPLGKEMDRIQRRKLNQDETDSIYVATTNLIDILNKVKLNEILPKEIELSLKELKKLEQNQNRLTESEEFDIFGGIVSDTRNQRKIANKSHRELPKDIFNILEINKNTKTIGYKLALEEVIKNIKQAIGKIKITEDAPVYKAMNEDDINKNMFNIFNFNIESETNEAIAINDEDSITLYKLNVEKGMNVVLFTNCIFYDNQNKTLPVGMDLSSKIIVDMASSEIKKRKIASFGLARLEDEKDDFADIKTVHIDVLEISIK